MSLLEELIAQVLLAEECGEPLDREGLLRRHPDVASALREFLADHDRLKASRPVPVPRSAAGVAADQAADGATIAFRPSGNGGSFGLRVGAEFGDYELLEVLGQGGMGIVFRARRRSLGNTVALKTLLPGALLDEEAVRRFYGEAEAAAQLDHPGIVPVFEVGQHDGQHYFSMGLVEGKTLAEHCGTGRLDPRNAAEIVRKVALAVEHAHARGVIHRDLKPANILLNQEGEPRVADFGLAKRQHGGQLTATGAILGTLAYMPPEQAAGRHNVGEAADIYALGAVLYRLVAGGEPFSGESQAELLINVLTREPPPPPCPRDLARICLRCLEKDPQRRYKSAAALAADLDRFLHGEPIHAAQDSAWRRLRKWVRRQPALAVHLAALGSVELLRHTKHWWLPAAAGGTEPMISGLIVAWMACSILFQRMLRRGNDAGGWAWVGADILFLTGLLLLLPEPHGPLLSGYPLTIVACGLLYRVRLVTLATLASIGCYLLLSLARPPSSPPHYVLLFIGLLLTFGLLVGSHVRRLKLLDQCYRRGLAGGSSDL